MKSVLHNEGIEMSVLSNLLSYPDLLPQYQEVMSDELFFNPTHKVVYNAIKHVYDEGEAPDILTVGMYLMKNPQANAPNPDDLAGISSYSMSSANFAYNIDVLRNLAKRRRYWVLGTKLVSVGTDLTIDIDHVDKDIDRIREENLQQSSGVFNMQAVNDALAERIEKNCNDDRASMVPTGFKLIDERGGFQLTDFNVIAGATSQGKSTLAINMLVNAAKAGVPGMFFTLEMTIEQLAARINSPFSGVSSAVMLYKKMRTDQIREFERAKKFSEKLPIYIDDTSTNFEKIKDVIRSFAIKRKVKVFFIDYVQVLSSTRKRQDSEAQFLETVCRELKNLAKELKVCIVALSQLNREAKDSDPRPSLSKLKGSGGIEQAADTIVFIYRPGYYGKRHRYRPELDPDSTAEMIIGKGRNIGVGTGSVGFRAENTYFYDLDSKEQALIPKAEQQPLPF